MRGEGGGGKECGKNKLKAVIFYSFLYKRVNLISSGKSDFHIYPKGPQTAVSATRVHYSDRKSMYKNRLRIIGRYI